jgi:protein involved in polysaccharide export with SLBB domain
MTGALIEDWIRPIVVASLVVLGGCAGSGSQPASVPATQFDEADREPVEYVIVPGDELEIKFFQNPELNERGTVRPDGKISLLLIDEVKVSGLTPAQLDDHLTELYNKDLKNPDVTVFIRSFTAQRIFVAGEVRGGGMVPLVSGMTAMQAVFSVGGFLETADPSSAFVIRRGEGNAPEPIPVNMKEALDGEGQVHDLVLRPYDIVFVPKSGIARANKVMTQYVKDLFLFNGWTYLWSYELNPTTINPQ